MGASSSDLSGAAEWPPEDGVPEALVPTGEARNDPVPSPQEVKQIVEGAFSRSKGNALKALTTLPSDTTAVMWLSLEPVEGECIHPYPVTQALKLERAFRQALDKFSESPPPKAEDPDQEFEVKFAANESQIGPFLVRIIRVSDGSIIFNQETETGLRTVRRIEVLQNLKWGSSPTEPPKIEVGVFSEDDFGDIRWRFDRHNYVVAHERVASLDLGAVAFGQKAGGNEIYAGEKVVVPVGKLSTTQARVLQKADKADKATIGAVEEANEAMKADEEADNELLNYAVEVAKQEALDKAEAQRVKMEEALRAQATQLELELAQHKQELATEKVKRAEAEAKRAEAEAQLNNGKEVWRAEAAAYLQKIERLEREQQVRRPRPVPDSQPALPRPLLPHP